MFYFKMVHEDVDICWCANCSADGVTFYLRIKNSFAVEHKMFNV